MIINEILYRKKWSKNQLAIKANIPYSTIEDIFSRKTKIGNLTLTNSIKLAKALDIDVKDVINLQNKTDEDVFRSMVSHNLVQLGDLNFIEKTIESNEIIKLYKNHLFFEALYLLSALDYVSNKNNIPLVKEYDYIRKLKLDSISYPKSIKYLIQDEHKLNKEFTNSIPEFKVHNIAERELYNAI